MKTERALQAVAALVLVAQLVIGVVIAFSFPTDGGMQVIAFLTIALGILPIWVIVAAQRRIREEQR